MDKVKAALRVSTEDDGINEEIKTLISSAKADLLTTGIHLDTDPFFELAIVVYCKANFGFDNPEAPRFLEIYESMKHKMMGTKEYRNAQQLDSKSHNV